MTGERRTVKFDPHVHTGASYDATGTVDEVLCAAASAGLDAVAITDHDTVEAARRARDRAARADVCVVPGVEVSTADGHLLALGVDRFPPVGDPVPDTVAWVRSEGGVAVVPHPFQRSRHGVRKRDLPDADGIETFNAWSMTGVQNRRARSFASRHGIATFGGSDAHDPSMVGRAYTLLGVSAGADLTSATVCDAVRRGEARARGTSAAVADYVRKYARSAQLKTRSTVRRGLQRASVRDD